MFLRKIFTLAWLSLPASTASLRFRCCDTKRDGCREARTGKILAQSRAAELFCRQRSVRLKQDAIHLRKSAKNDNLARFFDYCLQDHFDEIQSKETI